MKGRVVVVGVGDSRRGDDGVGPMMARLLAEAGVEDVIDGGPSPEIETWRVRESKPDSVLFIDAADVGGEPGEAALLLPSDLRATGFDTHRAPLKLTMEYLENELGCECCLLAVQPHDVREGASMCAEVEHSAGNLAGILVSCLNAGVRASRGEAGVEILPRPGYGTSSPDWRAS